MLVENTNSPTTPLTSKQANLCCPYEKDANDLSANSCFHKQKLADPSSLSSIFHDLLCICSSSNIAIA